MKILLAQRLPCFHARSGDTRLNLGILEALARCEHRCRMVGLAGAESPGALLDLRAELASRGISPAGSLADADMYKRNGVEIHVAPDGHRWLTHLAAQIRAFGPTAILVSEDRTYLGLATVLREAWSTPVVFLAYSQATLPFGPACFLPDPAKTAVLGRATRIVAPNQYIRDYISRWSDLEADVLPIPAYGSGPFPNLARHHEGFVTFVNPSQIKGLCIFEHLARARPDIGFAAVPTWATTSGDLARLRRLPNVSLLPPADKIDDILVHTRVLLVPSLWGEGVGMIAVEAMLRGIPVLASNNGGLPESMLGSDYVLPVRPIERYLAHTDERGLPVPVVPGQDVGPWLDALNRLLSQPDHYWRVSAASRAAALAHVSGLAIAPFEQLLQRLAITPTDRLPRRPEASALAGSGLAPPSEAPPDLSCERLEALAALLKTES